MADAYTMANILMVDVCLRKPLSSSSQLSKHPATVPKRILKKPLKLLDAPGGFPEQSHAERQDRSALVTLGHMLSSSSMAAYAGITDDFYSNILDWSASDWAAVGLHQAVWLWHSNTGQVCFCCYIIKYY